MPLPHDTEHTPQDVQPPTWQSREHTSVLHACHSLKGVQSAPDMMTDRERCRWPPPHVTEQLLHDDHGENEQEHAGSEQTLISLVSSQGAPPQLAGTRIDLEREVVPEPHDAVHDVHVDHDPMVQGTAQQRS